MKLTPASTPPDNSRFVILHYSGEYIAAHPDWVFPGDYSRTIIGRYLKGVWLDDMGEDVVIEPSHWGELPEMEF